jgi:small subunit ribosomal protein S4
MKLYLKGVRCETAKCPIEKQWRNKPPGMHTWQRRRPSEYGVRLREKQKLRWYYGVLERQFRRYYDTAITRRGLTGLNLLQILESRLDNVVFRLGFASSRAQARLLVTHGHFTVNGRRTDVPSMLLGEGDTIAVREGSGKLSYFKDLSAFAEKRTSPSWLNRELKSMSGSVARMPERAEIDGSLDEQLIVEYYSRR